MKRPQLHADNGVLRRDRRAPCGARIWPWPAWIEARLTECPACWHAPVSRLRRAILALGGAR